MTLILANIWRRIWSHQLGVPRSPWQEVSTLRAESAFHAEHITLHLSHCRGLTPVLNPSLHRPHAAKLATALGSH
jgi:hypothetical protein